MKVAMKVAMKLCCDCFVKAEFTNYTVFTGQKKSGSSKC